LICFNPSQYFDINNYPETLKATIISDIFGGKEWFILDNAEITTSNAIDAL